MDPEYLKEHGVDVEALGLSVADAGPEPKPPKPPMCERCHLLLHEHSGKSIFHPSIDSIKDTLMESPYKYNHVYHVIDAADFPMSILPEIHKFLDLMPLRTKNRRSTVGRFFHDQKTELSFIITRSDLLAPTKAQVDRLLPYLQAVLRDVLGRSARNVRLGNIRCVSARRSWWTKELKEDIWKRGGAGWMIGKVNVGKSQLFEAVFPKGRMNLSPSEHQIAVDMFPNKNKNAISPETMASTPSIRGAERHLSLQDDVLDTYALLPPAPKEIQYPEMPLVSDLPGTTASPIRVPFGNGRGELIDMPGLERTQLEHYVREEHRKHLIMKNRIVPEQMVIKPGQSLLIGGLIRITPRDPAPVVLSYAFTPIEPHLTATEKAIGIQEQTSDVNVENIAVPGTGEKIKLAGSFPLKWDVTKQRTGPITRKDSVHLDVERLPYRVLSADILIDGVGWVEVTAQVRTKQLLAPSADPIRAAVAAAAAANPPQPEGEGEGREERIPPQSQSEPFEESLSAFGKAFEKPETTADDANEQEEQMMEDTYASQPEEEESDQPQSQPEQPEEPLAALERLGALTEDPNKQPTMKQTPSPLAEAQETYQSQYRPEPDDGMTALERLEALAEDPSKKKKQQRTPLSPPMRTPPPTPEEPESGFDFATEWTRPQDPWQNLEQEPQEPNWPIIDVYSPEGKFIGYRRPLNGWMLNKPKVTAAQKRKRPRKSMKGAKKLEKQRMRERVGGGGHYGGSGGGGGYGGSGSQG
ncbi:hypothetical protein SLS62_002255 [Diatrype stigma]|uniref:Genetic interactor of prohibitins 3, mitochondrial n=1 Tax=Diatrype stigma TaxID=117547 RepID=A0AAN9YVS2_9PEZI